MTLSLARLGLMGGSVDSDSLEFISELTMDGSTSSYSITSIQESEYEVHFVQANDVRTSTNGGRMQFRVITSAGTVSSNSYSYMSQQNSPAGANETVNASTNNLPFIKNTGTVAHSTSNGTMYVYQAGSSTLRCSNNYISTAVDLNSKLYSWFGGGVYNAESVVTGFNFFSSGNLSGRVRLYGVKS
tara:strand:- start:1021 stop:1578 length:558 start_codon:yes stop_codon:yes gene_type:complete